MMTQTRGAKPPKDINSSKGARRAMETEVRMGVRMCSMLGD